ncbi:tetratricopeptide repeat protein [Zoogloea sp.]|uniref:tetratricopeptide repeat protein n=1 Tax=Zoogloea sp. TaxID=49181 RepID=UPI0035ADE021
MSPLTDTAPVSRAHRLLARGRGLACALAAIGPLAAAPAASAPPPELAAISTPDAPAAPPPPSRRPSVAAPDTPVRFRRAPPEAAPSHRLLTEAHDAFTAGQFALAQQRYRQVLALDPHDADALDGLGAIALREQRTAEASALFRRALLARPDDPVAVAGLSRLQGSDPRHAESRLRSALANRPDDTDTLAPRIALAELLARQQRWADAQQAWFQAHRLAPDDADIAYNLAVSLDHLGQPRQAGDFYRRALQLAAHQPTSRFPRDRCAARAHVLAPQP